MEALTALAGSSLRELRVPRWDVLGPRAVTAVVDALRRGSRLTALDLHASNLPPAVAHTLADVLSSPSCQLRSLRLSWPRQRQLLHRQLPDSSLL